MTGSRRPRNSAMQRRVQRAAADTNKPEGTNQGPCLVLPARGQVLYYDIFPSRVRPFTIRLRVA